MFLSPADEFISVVNGCESKTSTDCDDIDFRLIKIVITSIVKPIKHIFNLSFQNGTFTEKNESHQGHTTFEIGVDKLFQ